MRKHPSELHGIPGIVYTFTEDVVIKLTGEVLNLPISIEGHLTYVT